MTNSTKQAGVQVKKKKDTWKEIKKNKMLYAMLLLPIIHLVLFKYKPMIGVIVAFKKYNIFAGMWDSPWIGFDHFIEMFSANQFWTALKNTIILNFGDLIIGFPIPIILAILLYEVNSKKVRTATQMITYLPNFLSWVIIAGIVNQIFSGTGLINSFLDSLGISSIPFLSSNTWWRVVYWITGVWQSAGYSLIIYMAALAGVDTSLYEASYLDGAGRFKRIWHITIPQIKGTITTLLIMSLGKVFTIGFERPYMMSNPLVSDASQVISTYVYSVGLGAGRFDFATAVGLFQSVIGVVMILSVNGLISKMGEEGIM